MKNKHSDNDNIMSLRESTERFISQWHNDFVLDYWWRKKYNIPFGSPQHKAMCPIDMLIEWQEEKRIKRMQKAEEEREMIDANGFMPMSQKEIDEDYENIDLEQFNK